MFDYKMVTALNVEILQDFQTFLGEININSEKDITKENIRDYIIARRTQAVDLDKILIVIAEYFLAVHNDYLANEAGIHTEAGWHFENIAALTKRELGEDIWCQVFGNIIMPKTGWTLDEISDFTRQMHKNLNTVAPQKQIENMLQKYAHGYEQSFDDTLSKIVETQGIDGLINHLNDNHIRELEKCQESGVLMDCAVVDDDVINFYKMNPLNYRIGNKLINKQGPNLTHKFLHETDEKMKRYYGCHCPIKKQSILQNEGGLSHSLCYCCFGHSKKQFEAAFGRAITGRVIKTRMDEGCLECVFEIDIPDEFLK